MQRQDKTYVATASWP